MATDCIAIVRVAFRFQRNSKPVLTAFDVAHASSDDGAPPLKALDERVTTYLTDPHQPEKVQYKLIELLGSAWLGTRGCADYNDAVLREHLRKLVVWVEWTVRRT